MTKRNRREEWPKFGEKVWDVARYVANLQPNGYVVRVDRANNIVVTQYYDDKPLIVSHDVDAFIGNYTDHFGGTWYVNILSLNTGVTHERE